MLENTVVLYNFFLIFIVFTILFSFFAYFSPKHYKEKRIKFYALFLNLHMREIVLISSSLLNLLLVFFIVMNIEVFDLFTVYLLVINTILFVVISLNPRLIMLDVLYTGSMVLILRLLYLVDAYLNNVYFDKSVYALKAIFMVLILCYCLLSNMRKYELIILSNKYVRRNT